MQISVAEAKSRLTELIRAVEDGEQVVITRCGKPVAQLTRARLLRTEGAPRRNEKSDPAAARKAILAGPNILSAVVYWEAAGFRVLRG